MPDLSRTARGCCLNSTAHYPQKAGPGPGPCQSVPVQARSEGTLRVTRTRAHPHDLEPRTPRSAAWRPLAGPPFFSLWPSEATAAAAAAAAAVVGLLVAHWPAAQNESLRAVQLVTRRLGGEHACLPTKPRSLVTVS
jgi:hypothetical protein